MNLRRRTATCGCTCGSSWRLVVAIVTIVGGCDAPKSASTDDIAARSVALAEAHKIPTAAEPVVWSATAVPERVAAGAEFVVEIRAEIAPGSGIQPLGGAAGGPSVPTTVELKLPMGVEAVGDWELPEARRSADKPGAVRSV